MLGHVCEGCIIAAQDCPDVIKTWAQAVAQGLLQGWIVFDPLVIIVRNNIKITKKSIRSKRYQMIEKAVMAPVSAFLKFLGRMAVL